MTAIVPGLCSVTFRKLAPQEIVELASSCELKAIEWGGDVHVPPGDLNRAEEIAGLCLDADIACPSFGSYLVAGAADTRSTLSPILETAQALGAGNVRIWAGRMPSGNADRQTWDLIRDDIIFVADQAAKSGLTVSLEYHRNTLTERAQDTVRLLGECARPNLYTYWQPVPGRGLARWKDEVSTLAPWLGFFHVFHWISDGKTGADIRCPLEEGESDWASLLDQWQPAPSWPHGRQSFLEFVTGDSIAQFEKDAKVLKRLSGLGPQTDHNDI